ncbi:MAG TPA: nitroreductase [Anaerolineales bacterium]|nr:nitroreductase [Anaerolineales bacterium]
MDIFEAIHNRQSIGKVKPDAVPRELIEKILAAAAQAPNHHHVRPWRFVVLTGSGRERLGEAMAESIRQRDPNRLPAALEAERAKFLRAPALIAIGVDKPNEPKVVEIENICAAAAASQNILLAAHGLGLAAMWRTGPAATDPNVKALLGFAPDQHLIGFIYIGYPLVEPAKPNRPSFEDRTRWME